MWGHMYSASVVQTRLATTHEPSSNFLVDFGVPKANERNTIKQTGRSYLIVGATKCSATQDPARVVPIRTLGPKTSKPVSSSLKCNLMKHLENPDDILCFLYKYRKSFRLKQFRSARKAFVTVLVLKPRKGRCHCLMKPFSTFYKSSNATPKAKLHSTPYTLVRNAEVFAGHKANRSQKKLNPQVWALILDSQALNPHVGTPLILEVWVQNSTGPLYQGPEKGSSFGELCT